MVPIGSAMIGTVIVLASTTETSGGGGTRPVSAFEVQPATAAEAQIAEAIARRVLDVDRSIVIGCLLVGPESGLRSGLGLS